MPDSTSNQRVTLPNTLSWINWGLGALYLMSCVFSVVSFAVLMPSIESKTGLSQGTLSAITGVFFFTYAFAQLVAGLLIDRIGSRWLLGWTAIIASVGGVLFIWTDNVLLLYLARSLMGIGLSSSFVGALYLASKWFPASRFGVMSGITNMSANFAGAIGSWAIAGISYQPVVLWWALINAGLAVLILMFVKSRVPNLNNEQPKEEGAVGLLHMFGTLFKSKQVWLASLFFTGTFGAFLCYANFWNIQIQQGYGHSIEVAASFNALLSIGLALGGVVFGLFSDHIRKVAYPCRICAISSLIFFSALIYLPSLPVWVVVVLLFISGFSIGGATLAFPAVVQHCTAGMQGTAIGLVTTCGYIGAGILNLIVPMLIGEVPKFQTSTFSFINPVQLTAVQSEIVSAFKVGMIPLVVSLILAVVATLMMRDASKKNDASGSLS